ncbi:glycosyltransferase family 2 protein [Cytobacillus firmus]|uniref:glycosyltransferase family 2 protein n=1 Tax=Cytobacillus firmus TaxID=1399 RepID=UPI002FFFC508
MKPLINFWQKKGMCKMSDLQNFKSKKPYFKETDYTVSRFKKSMNPNVSIILPTYNKKNELTLTLQSLECQMFSKRGFEAVVCDDGSNDGTEAIRFSEFSFPITYIRSNKNIGRPSIRNLGIRNASADVLIFLDSEIAVKPDFIEKHYEAHLHHDKLVVCGSMVLHGVFARYDPKFNEDQKKILLEVMKEDENQLKAIRNAMEQKIPLQLLDRDDIHNQTFQNRSFEKPFVKIYRNTIFREFGDHLTGFHFPWLLFCTGNVSVKSAAILEAGLFEEYPGYGWDDHEMGYRLYKRGYSFFNHTGLVAFHQEHPIAKSNPLDARKNFVRVYQKYPDIQLRVFALHFIGITLLELNEVYKAYLTFIEKQPEYWTEISQLFVHMLDQIASKLWKGESLTKLAEGCDAAIFNTSRLSHPLLKEEKIRPFAELLRKMIYL